jgi:hypothetical protein
MQSSDRPLNLDEICGQLELPRAFVAYMLVENRRSGRIDKLAGERYAWSGRATARETSKRARYQQLDELLQFVLQCEAEWRFDDKLELLDRIRR